MLFAQNSPMSSYPLRVKSKLLTRTYRTLNELTIGCLSAVITYHTLPSSAPSQVDSLISTCQACPYLRIFAPVSPFAQNAFPDTCIFFPSLLSVLWVNVSDDSLDNSTSIASHPQTQHLLSSLSFLFSLRIYHQLKYFVFLPTLWL